MKSRLENLYKEYIERIRSVREKYSKYDLEGPFLISVSDKYEKCHKKLFIIGQQTNGWESDLENIQNQMKHYEDFNLGEKYYSSPFWNVFHKIEEVLLHDKNCSAWGNFNRFDLEADRPTGEIEAEISTLDFLIRKEIEILKPDICLFLIGYSFDDRIKSVFDSATFNKINEWDIRRLCRIKHETLPYHTYRTYHPKYLRLSKLEDPFIDFLKKEIK